MVGPVDRHADVMQKGATRDDHLGIPCRHAVVDGDSRLDPRLNHKAQQAKGDVEDDLRMDP